MVGGGFFVRLAVLAALLTGMAGTAWAGLKATVDRTVLTLGETVTLTLERDGDSDDDVDLAPLERDFQVLNRASSSRIEIINGHMVSQSGLSITLLPRTSGKLTIPALKAGADASRAIAVEVRPPGADAGPDREIFLESEVDREQPYVQQQVLLTLRLFHAVPIQEGGLSVPGAPDLLVEPLGEDNKYTRDIQGRTYQVLERRYALFPQKSGALPLSSAVFQGQIADRSGSARRRGGFFGSDPFDNFLGRSPLGGLFQTGKPVRLAAPEITLNVQPRPDSASGWWLPAAKVTLGDSWEPEPPVFRVGEPVTRQVILEAEGVHASLLRVPPHPDADGIKVYPDAPRRDNRVQGDRVVGTLSENRAVIPTRPGPFTMPEIRVPWWDTGAGRMREALLPPRTFDVLPAAGGGTALAPVARPSPPPAPSVVAPTPPPDAPVAAQPVPAAAVPVAPGYWPWLAGLFLAAWLLTLFLWWRQGRQVGADAGSRKSGQGLLAVRQRRRALEQACLGSAPPGAVRDALLAWCRTVWPENAPLTLGAVAEGLADPRAMAVLERLQQALYGPAPVWDGAGFWTDLKPLLGRSDAPDAASTTPPLPPLNP